VGSLAYLPWLAVLFFAIALGAIVQVIIKMVKLIQFDTAAIVTRVNVGVSIIGFAIVFILEEVVVEGLTGV